MIGFRVTMYNTNNDAIFWYFPYRYYHRGDDLPADFPLEGWVRSKHEPNIFTESVCTCVNNKQMKQIGTVSRLLSFTLIKNAEHTVYKCYG